MTQKPTVTFTAMKDGTREDDWPLAHFAPKVREIFGRRAHDPDVIREGHVARLSPEPSPE